MTIHGIDHINLRGAGKGYQELRAFYCGVLGLEPGVRPPLRSSGLWLYAGGSPIVHLVELSERDADASQSAAPSALDHVALHCSNLDLVLAKLQRLGVPHVVNEVAAAGQVQVRLKDPTGLTLELVFSSSQSVQGEAGV